MLAGGNGLQHQRARHAVAADQLDDDVDGGVAYDFARIGHDLQVVAHGGTGARHVEIGDHGDGDAAPGTPADFFLVAQQHLVSAAADGADAEQADLDGVHEGINQAN